MPNLPLTREQMSAISKIRNIYSSIAVCCWLIARAQDISTPGRERNCCIQMREKGWDLDLGQLQNLCREVRLIKSIVDKAVSFYGAQAVTLYNTILGRSHV